MNPIIPTRNSSMSGEHPPSLNRSSLPSHIFRSSSGLVDPLTRTRILDALRRYGKFERNLTEWCDECDIGEKEKIGRKKAAERIRSCYSGRSSECDLSCLNLTSLPNLNFIPTLEVLDLVLNDFTKVDLRGLPALKSLELVWNSSLTSVNLQDLPALKRLKLIWNRSLTSVNLQYLPALETLDCRENDLTAINLQGLPTLNNLDLSGNRFITVGLQGLPRLTILDLRANSLTSIDLRDLPTLNTLRLQKNPLSAVNLQDLPALQTLDLSENTHLTTAVLLGLTALWLLNLRSSHLTAINLQGLTALRALFLNCNRFSSFEDIILPTIPNALTTISLADNPFEPLERPRTTMRIYSGVIQDIPEDMLGACGVEIIPRPRDIHSPEDNRFIFSRLLKELDLSSYQILLDHQDISILATFLNRMMHSWPRYDDSLRSFLTLARDNANFREDLFELVVSTSTSCHDRSLYFFSKLSALKEVYQAEAESRNFIPILISLKHLDLIELEARKVFENEALEIALYLQLCLKNKLNLPIAIKDMGHSNYAEIAIQSYLSKKGLSITIQEWVDTVEKTCRSALANEEQQLELFADSSFLQKSFANHPSVLTLNQKFAEAFELFSEKNSEDSEAENNAISDEVLSLANKAFNKTTTLSLQELRIAISKASGNDIAASMNRLQQARQIALGALFRDLIMKSAGSTV